MDRMVMAFSFREDLTWSDGNPVTAGDSFFSYQLADNTQSSGDQWALDRTETYFILDERTIQWVGRPGFSTADLEKFFWYPLPSYLYEGDWSLSEVQMDSRLTSSPLSYGPFVLSDWGEGQMYFKPNPYYTHANEGLPILDALTVQQVGGGPQAAWKALKSGQCDLLDSSFGIENDWELLLEIQEDELFEVYSSMRGDWMQLVFGMEGIDDQPGFLENSLTRQAIVACLDREQIRDVTTGGLSPLWSSFLPPERSQLDLIDQLSYDPQNGQDLLEQVGWRDNDGDPGTPLTAEDVVNVPIGTELSLSLWVSNSGLHKELAGIIQESLAGCGIGVVVNSMSSEALYAPGPNGPLFGRRFDLALISWQPMPDLDCKYYLTSQIPDTDNSWIGTNIAGLSNVGYDQVCCDAALALPDVFPDVVTSAEQSYLSLMPSIPLFSVPQVIVASPIACFTRAFSTELELFESLAYYDLCP
jgi:peptide/nickel transport system substrate-binding protein